MSFLRIFTLLASTQFACLLLAQEPEVWIDSSASKLPTSKLGPFVHTADGTVLAIESDATFISADGGATWSELQPLIGAIDKNIQVSNERAMLRTKDGTIVAAFMNLNERKWTWSNELHDAPGAQLPTWVMRSEDDGKTWTHVQKMHDDWSGAVRDMIQTKEGRIIFTAMKMQHDPGRHSVLTYSSTDENFCCSNRTDNCTTPQVKVDETLVPSSRLSMDTCFHVLRYFRGRERIAMPTNP